MKKNVIGIAIGGTKSAVSYAVLDNYNLNLVKKIQIETDPNDAIKTLDLICKTIDSFNIQIDLISVISGGPQDIFKGIIINPPHLPGFKNFEIVKYFKNKYQVETYFINDADACALAEYIFGNKKVSKNMAFITFGTGIGCGLILNGSLFLGNNGMAGEIGHIRLSENGPMGYGKVGSVEGYCAGGNIFKNALCNANNTKELFDLARNNDELALKDVDNVAKRLGETLSILIDLLNLDTIIIGGIYFRNLDLLKDKVLLSAKENSISNNFNNCKIVPSYLKESIDDYSSLMAIYLGGYLK